jgi:hypothetical protein
MKKIAIATIGILVALYLAAYRPWRTGGQAEKDSAGGLNVAQDGSRPATGAPEVKQSVKDVQRPVKEIKQRVTGAQGAKRHGKGVKASTAGMRRDAQQRVAGLEVQVIETPSIETPSVERLTIDITRPTEYIEVISIESEGEFKTPSVEPVYIEDGLPARRINVAVPEPLECFTPYVWVEVRSQ